MSLTIRYVGIGACVSSGSSGSSSSSGPSAVCAVDPEACPNGGSFVPHSALAASTSAPARECQTATLSHIQGARCRDPIPLFQSWRIPEYQHAARLCVNQPTSCLNPEQANLDSSTCSLVHDSHPQFQDPLFRNTKYPKCEQKDGNGAEICVWNVEDCPNQQDYTTTKPYQNISDCPCHNVQTGACVPLDPSFDLVCAVSKQACESGYDFVEMDNLQQNHNIDCRLCQPDESASLPPSASVVSATLLPTLVSIPNHEYPPSVEEQNAKAPAIGVTLAIVMVLLALVPLVIMAWRKWRQRQFVKKRHEEDIFSVIFEATTNDHSTRPIRRESRNQSYNINYFKDDDDQSVGGGGGLGDDDNTNDGANENVQSHKNNDEEPENDELFKDEPPSNYWDTATTGTLSSSHSISPTDDDDVMVGVKIRAQERRQRTGSLKTKRQQQGRNSPLQNEQVLI